jgi:hypothetical protein
MDVIGFLCVSLGSSTVQLHDSLVNRRTCKCSEAGFSSKNGDRVWELYYRRTAFCCAVFLCFFFCGQKDSIQKIFMKKYFLFTVGSVCRVKRFTAGSRNTVEDVPKSQMMSDQVGKRLRQQSKDFCAAGFDALLKRGDKYIKVSGG